MKKLKGMVMQRVLFFMLVFSFFACSNTSNEEQQTKHSLQAIKSVQTDYSVALKLAKEEKKSIFILMETAQCKWCQKLKETTLQDEVLSQRLNSEFIFLRLDRDNDEYPSKYKAKGVPTVYMIDSSENIYTRQVGYRKNPKDYIRWFDYIQIENGS